MAISSTSSSSTNNISRLDNNTNTSSTANTQKSTTASKSLAGISVSLAQPPQDSPVNTQRANLRSQQDNLSVNGVTSTNSLARTASASLPDTAYDGKFVGANNQIGDSVNDIQPVKPNNGIAQTGKTVFYVNGIQTNLAAQQSSLQAIANKTGANVIGIHNSTEGFAKDVAQSALDKTDLGKNPPVDTLADAIYNAAKTGKPINIVAHSQGGIITSRAVEDATNRLREDGLSSQAARAALGRTVNIQTLGGAALTYPAGPNYRHVVNTADPVPALLGKGAVADKNTELFRENRAGLNPLKVFENHSLENVYLPRLRADLFR